ncbi:MAG: SDR family NAD(P)-dependent oxidoreductase [Rhodospirillaceae bacterium]|jgi:NAD(P)-dependent dehydrogenase (short-subunit alcohol dehydrogenase family)|nr:SDR family NAD(P)-dependent oxidoreductase [Rhodospirillaceae bacterium]MBT3491450.1 SDR family NAD(P)-dependent oxidoreductase [Rhodospirillaceae bacterium]MBT3781441.1 SDR family NAD(P)-dependent oxidoreductase [Rhodospirillaceae bacterium]MBT3978854.1 SDR family NAD(P)-dependent oxidoreductase [Rhodospirillaceae bacterium]MBT4167882.1 SDR family NAD(P)-dependent oxidoreductase [Rhodospirillaceae bacterium]
MADDGYNLAGKVALVTGASSGLGRRAAMALAEAGARVALTARRVDRLEALAAEITNYGGQAMPFALDVRDPVGIERVVADIETVMGPIEILVNNAGVSVVKRPEDFTVEDYDYIHETNVKGPFFLAQAVGREMIKRGQGGKIINISSMMALRVLGKLSLYAMSKAAIGQMTKQMALEWARHDIQVNAICPGYIETEMNRDHWQTEAGRGQIAGMPRRRMPQPEVMDGLLLLLASEKSDYMTGTLIPLDDGQVLM